MDFLDEVTAFLDASSREEAAPLLEAATTDAKHLRVSGGQARAVASELWMSTTKCTTAGSLSLVTSEITGANLKSRKEKEAIRKRMYHHKLRGERDTLRREVDELALQLQRLRQDRYGVAAAGVNLKLASGTWRNAATHQRDQRIRAEVEQFLLFAAARSQAAYIESFSNRPANSAASTSTSTDSAPVVLKSPALATFDQILFEAHLRGLQSCYTRADEVFSELESLGIPDGVTASLHRCADTGEVAYFQHTNKFVQPYSYQQTQQAMWKLAELQHRQQDREIFRGLKNAKDFIVIRFRLFRTLADGRSVSVLQRYIIRRRVERNRTVLVWKTISEGEGYFHSMYMDESGWLCLQPASEDGSTLVRICARQTFMRYNFSGVSQTTIGEFARVLQSSIDEDMREISRSLDEMLLKDTLAGIEV